MRGDVQVPDAGIIGQRHRHRRLLPPGAPALLQQVRDAARAERIPSQGERDGGRKLRRAVLVEQVQQAVDLRPEGFAPGREPLEQLADRGDRLPQPVATRQAAGMPLGGDEIGEVGAVLDGDIDVFMQAELERLATGRPPAGEPGGGAS